MTSLTAHTPVAAPQKHSWFKLVGWGLFLALLGWSWQGAEKSECQSESVTSRYDDSDARLTGTNQQATAGMELEVEVGWAALGVAGGTDSGQQLAGPHPLAEAEVFEPHRESAVKIFEGSAHVIALFPRRLDEPIQTGEVQLIVGPGFLISIHQADFQDVDRVLEQWGSVPDEWRQTSSSLVYAILSQVMRPFAPLTDAAGSRSSR